MTEIKIGATIKTVNVTGPGPGTKFNDLIIDSRNADIIANYTPVLSLLRKRHPNIPDISLGSLSREVGISLSHASLLMNGKRTPSVMKAAAIAKELGISIEELIDAITEVRSRNHTKS